MPTAYTVNPARAGMIRPDGVPGQYQPCKPRASGDDPAIHASQKVVME